MFVNQNFDIPVTVANADGSAAALDAGATASCSDGSVTATLNAEQTSVNVRSADSAVTGVVLTVEGSVAGLACTPGTFTFDVDARPVPATITLGTPTEPVDN